MAPILEVKNIHKSFSGNSVLSDVSFAVETGQVHALVGENGAGKSTLMNIIGGLVPADSGEIWLDGARAETIALNDLSQSLYLFYRQRLGLWIMRAEDRIGQGALPDWAPAEFPHAPGSLLPRIDRLAWAQDGQTAEASFTWYDPVTVRYTVRLK